jgi:hypothetical protein
VRACTAEICFMIPLLNCLIGELFVPQGHPYVVWNSFCKLFWIVCSPGLGSGVNNLEFFDYLSFSLY